LDYIIGEINYEGAEPLSNSPRISFTDIEKEIIRVLIYMVKEQEQKLTLFLKQMKDSKNTEERQIINKNHMEDVCHYKYDWYGVFLNMFVLERIFEYEYKKLNINFSQEIQKTYLEQGDNFVEYIRNIDNTYPLYLCWWMSGNCLVWFVIKKIKQL
jgi:hypothetical protein